MNASSLSEPSVRLGCWDGGRCEGEKNRETPVFVFGHYASLFIEQRPFSKAFMQHDSIKMNGNHFRGTDIASTIQQQQPRFPPGPRCRWNTPVPARYQQRMPHPKGDVNLHLEHLSAFFWRPIPPNITVLPRCGRARTRYIGKNDVKTRRRDRPK